MIRVLYENKGLKFKYLADAIKKGSKSDILAFFDLPTEDSKYVYFTHCTTKGNSGIESIAKTGIKLNNGKLWACSGGEVRDDNFAYVVFRVPKDELDDYLKFVGVDRDNIGAREYKEYVFKKAIAPELIVKVVKIVVDATGFEIREDELVNYILETPDDPDFKDLPAPYNKLPDILG